MTAAPISNRHIWQIAYPVLLSVMVEQIVSLTDTAFLGRVGEVELAASALGGVYFISIFVLCLGFATGSQIIMSRRNGEGRHAAIGEVFFHSLVFLLLLAAVVFVLTRWSAPWVMALVAKSPDVAAAAVAYLDWRVLGLFFSAVACLYRGFYVAITQTAVLTWNSVVMVVVNVVLDYLLIFGHCGLPRMGIAGAALASALAGLASMVFFIIYTKARINLSKYALNRLPRLRAGLFRGIFSVSVWSMLKDFLDCFTWFLFFAAVGTLGTSELAVSNVVRAISSVFFMIIAAFGLTATTLTGNLMGEGRTAEVPRALRRCIGLCALLLLPIAAFVVAFPGLTLRIFTSDAHLIAAGRAPLLVLVSSYVLTIPAHILFRIVVGSGNTRTAFVVDLAAIVAYVAFIWIVIVRMQAPLAVGWLSEHVFYGFILIFSLIYLKKGKWHQKQV